ncbi:MAG: D-alanyl-D-alanine carboxypeptidase family protein [Bdellovibrionales bacterium]
MKHSIFPARTLLLIALLAFGGGATAYAESTTAPSVAPVETAAKQAFLLDATTGTPLFAKDADSKMPTSSMSKLLTMYLVFEALRDGKLRLDDTLTASEHAWKQEGSRMFLNVGQKAKVEDLVRGVIVQSGNDAAVTLAEALGGSEGNFAEMMNAKARQLGMTNSHFVNATGMPDPEHYSTARDLARLALALIRDFPQNYHYYSELEFTFNNIKQGNRNPLLYRNMNVDGLKTGHTEAGGFGLTASALRNGRRLILVLNGMTDMQARADESAQVLDWGYREFGLYRIAEAGQHLANANVWLGQSNNIELVAQQALSLTLPRAARTGLTATVDFIHPIHAPIVKGQQLGKLIVTAPGTDPVEVPLLAAKDVPRVGLLDRIAAKAKLLLHKT